MKSPVYKMKSRMWLYPGKVAWHFVTLPKKHSEHIQKNFKDIKKGWGSLPVSVTIGKTKWETSIFPSKASGAYFLPIKKEVRKVENIKNGDMINYSIEIRL